MDKKQKSRDQRVGQLNDPSPGVNNNESNGSTRVKRTRVAHQSKIENEIHD